MGVVQALCHPVSFVNELGPSVVSQPLLVISTEGRDLLSVLNAKISRICSK